MDSNPSPASRLLHEAADSKLDKLRHLDRRVALDIGPCRLAVLVVDAHHHVRGAAGRMPRLLHVRDVHVGLAENCTNGTDYAGLVAVLEDEQLPVSDLFHFATVVFLNSWLIVFAD